MNNKANFQENVIKALMKAVPEMKIAADSSRKGCITAVFSDGERSATLFTDDFFREYANGIPFEWIVNEAANGLRTLNSVSSDAQTIIGDYSDAKGRIIPRLVNTEYAGSTLTGLVQKPIDDMSLIFTYVPGHYPGSFTAIRITKDMLDSFGITEDELYHDALENAKAKRPYEIASLNDVLNIDQPKIPLYVLTASQAYEFHRYGAIAVLYPEALKYFSDCIGGDFHIIPSSVHEVLLLPEDEYSDNYNVKELLTGVNEDLIPEDVLSSYVYKYDSDNEEVVKAL